MLKCGVMFFPAVTLGLQQNQKLTLMATIQDLEDSDSLVRYEPVGLRPNEMPVRVLLASQAFCRWAEEELSKLPAKPGRDLTPFEQVSDVFRRFVVDPNFKGTGVFQNIIPQGEGVYEIKTTDMRIFGWFYRRGIFITHAGAPKGGLRFPEIAAIRKTITVFRKQLRLEEPPYIRSSFISDLL